MEKRWQNGEGIRESVLQLAGVDKACAGVQGKTFLYLRALRGGGCTGGASQDTSHAGEARVPDSYVREILLKPHELAKEPQMLRLFCVHGKKVCGCDDGDVRQRWLQVQQRPRLRTGEDLLCRQTMYDCKTLRRHRLDAETKLDAERAGQKSKEGTLRGVLFDCR